MKQFCTKRMLLILQIICLTALVPQMPLRAQHSEQIKKMQAEQTAKKKEIGEMEKLLNTTKKDVASQLKNLSVLDAQILEQQKYIDSIRAESRALTRAIKRQQNELIALEKDLNACKDNYRRAMNYVARSRRQQSRWMFVLMAQDFRQMYRRLRYASQYSKYQRAQGEVIRQKEIVVREKQAQLIEAKKSKELLLAERKIVQTQLEDKKKDRQSVVAQLSKKQKQIQKKLKQERKKYQQLNQKIDQLIQQEIAAAEKRRKEEERKRKAEEERRKKEEAAKQKKKSNKKKANNKEQKQEKTEQPKTATPKFNAPENDERQLNSDFASNKGRLPVPITGTYAVTSRFGKYNVQGLKNVTLENKGVNLTGRTGAQARCIFDGEVCSVAVVGGVHVVIVRHGSYFSVYSNLSKVFVRRGQKVKTRQLLGDIGRDDSGGRTLHFQLRKNTQKLNPLQWIGR